MTAATDCWWIPQVPSRSRRRSYACYATTTWRGAWVRPDASGCSGRFRSTGSCGSMKTFMRNALAGSETKAQWMNRMLISVIICTYKRVDATRQLLRCLAAQTYRPFEVLVVDGSGDRCGTRAALAETIRELSDRMDVRLIESAKGLTVQRNVGIDLAAGEIVAFFDDDVTIHSGFLAQTAELFEQPDMNDVGGIAGYDTRNYGQ